LDIAESTLIAKQVPALECAQFIHKGAERELPLTLDYVYHTWLPRSGLRLSLPWVLERFGDNAGPGQGPDPEWEIYIPVQTPARSTETRK
jgi:predicted transcriptional regulator YdeE